MPAEIKREQQSNSAQMPNEATETVSKAELNELRASKRKLEEIEPQFQANKRRLEEAELQRQKDEEKLKQLKALVATDVKFQPKRARISLALPDFAKSMEQQKETNFILLSTPLDIAGFEWKLGAFNGPNSEWMELFLKVFRPPQYKGPFDSFRVINVFSQNDITKGIISKKFKRDGRRGWLTKVGELKTLLEPANGFLHGDGSVQVEVDFTVKTATLDHFLVDEADQQDSSSNNPNANEESVGEE